MNSDRQRSKGPLPFWDAALDRFDVSDVKLCVGEDVQDAPVPVRRSGQMLRGKASKAASQGAIMLAPTGSISAAIDFSAW